MTLIDRLALFSPLDLIACALLLLSWLGIGWRIENAPKGKPSVSELMAQFRISILYIPYIVVITGGITLSLTKSKNVKIVGI